MIPARWILVLTLLLLDHVQGQTETTRPTSDVTVRIGVLALRGAEAAHKSWDPTAEYLSQTIPNTRFVIVPLEFSRITEAVRNREVDFVATQAANYVELEQLYGVTRIATLTALRDGVVYTQYAAVIFTRADRADINELEDLRGRSFMAVEPNSFGGWWVAWRELRQAGIDPDDFASLSYGRTHDAVMYAVRDGAADAGTVRADLLPQMAAEGRVDLAEFKVLNLQPADSAYDLPRSTRLYPEWPMARLSHISDGLAKQVAVALLQMPPDGPAAQAARSAGWTIPLDYSPVHGLLRELRIGPYKDFGKVSLGQAARQYWPWAAGALALLLVMLATTAYFLRLNRRLRSLQVDLKGELAQRQKAQEALSESESRHRAVVRHAAEGITLVDAQTLRILEVNQAFESLLGYTRDELVGRPISDLIVDSADGVAERARRTLDAAAPVFTQRQYRRKDGSTVDVEKSATVLQLGGRGVLCTVIHDVTEKNRARRLIEEKNRLLEQSIASERQAHQQLKEAQGALVQAEKLAGLGQMVAGVAHEINNPLSFVSNNVAVLERDLRPLADLVALYRQADQAIGASNPALLAQISDLADRIDLAYTLPNLNDLTARSREGLKRIQQIVRDLRDFARLDEGDQNDVDLNAGIQSTINIIQGRAKRKQVQLTTELTALPSVTCNAAKINQVVMNLLANAIDACQDGGRVRVRSSAEGGEIRISVEDNGSGIDPAIRGRIFDPFFTTKPIGEGTGLGLSISYGIIREHGGRIDLQSQVGQGTTFTIILPVSRRA